MLRTPIDRTATHPYNLYMTIVNGTPVLKPIGARYPDDVDIDVVDRYVANCLRHTDARFLLRKDWQLREIHVALQLPEISHDRLLAFEIDLPLPEGISAHPTIPVIVAVDYDRSQLPLTIACDITSAITAKPLKAAVIAIDPNRHFQVTEVGDFGPPRQLIAPDQPLTQATPEVIYSQFEL